jgi:hypothetical protein
LDSTPPAAVASAALNRTLMVIGFSRADSMVRLNAVWVALYRGGITGISDEESARNDSSVGTAAVPSSASMVTLPSEDTTVIGAPGSIVTRTTLSGGDENTPAAKSIPITTKAKAAVPARAARSLEAGLGSLSICRSSMGPVLSMTNSSTPGWPRNHRAGR